jgi:putative MATE family efflux protein
MFFNIKNRNSQPIFAHSKKNAMSSQSSSPTALGTADVKKLLLQYSFPAIIGMIAMSLYNIIDSIFIGHGVGPLAIAGLAVAFPLMNLAAAFGTLAGIGGSTLVSIKLGQRDYKGASCVLGNVVVLNTIIGILFSVFGLVFIDEILFFFGASNETINYTCDFMEIILYGNVITHLYFGLNNVMRASGYPRKAMITTLLAVFVNIVLAPIFIFWFEWGMRGAATATVLAQLAALLWAIAHFKRKKSTVYFQPGIFKLQKQIVKEIFAIGMAPFILNACAGFVVILINQSLYRHGGDLAIGAYGIINRLVMLIVMTVMGFTQGMQPIAGYNFGARQYDRVLSVLRLTIIYVVSLTTFAFLAGQLFPRQLTMMFTSDETLIELSINGIRIVMAAFPIVGFQMVISNFFQSIGKAKSAIFISTTRQVLFLIPLLLTLPACWGVEGVWASMPIADVASVLTAGILLYLELKKWKKGQMT